MTCGWSVLEGAVVYTWRSGVAAEKGELCGVAWRGVAWCYCKGGSAVKVTMAGRQ